MSNIIKPPLNLSIDNNFISIFLAGTIGLNSEYEDWQFAACNKLMRYDVNIYNPRRDKWIGSSEQNISNVHLKNQINWELEHLENCDFILMNLLGDSKSPISLLELGMYAKSGKLIIACPKDFYRYGNIQVVCERYNITLYDNFGTLLDNFIKTHLTK